MNNYSVSDNESDDLFSIFLQIVEGIGLHRKEDITDYYDRHKHKIILIASLNGVKFEVEGHATETSIIFNSNCVWECELGDLKRMKTDNRPVKLECFMTSDEAASSPMLSIGSLLLPLRGIQIVNKITKDIQFKHHWHKLSIVSSGWRPNKPEIYLLLTIAKKTLVENGQLELMLGKEIIPFDTPLEPESETATMLQSQSNVYVQLIEQLGVIQVGNDPDQDCDIFIVTLIMKEIKNVAKLIESERNYNKDLNTLTFEYDFLGNIAALDIILDDMDVYEINEKMALKFKTSMNSLRNYFQRIFYLPVKLYWNDTALATCRLDFSKLLPENYFFKSQKLWAMDSTISFNRLHQIMNPEIPKPLLDFNFSLELISSFSRPNNNNNNNKNNIHLLSQQDAFPMNEEEGACALPIIDERKAAGDGVEFRNESFRKLSVVLNPMEASGLSTQQYSSQRNPSGYDSAYELNYINTKPCDREMPIGKPDPNVGDSSNTSDHKNKDQNDEISTTIFASNEVKKDLSGHGLQPVLAIPDPPKNEGQNILSPTNCDQKDITEQSMEIDSPAETNRTFSMGRGNKTMPDDDDKVIELVMNMPGPEDITDHHRDMHYRIVQELEEWKAHQVQHFLAELELKESVYIAKVEESLNSDGNGSVLQSKLDAKCAECKQLEIELHNVREELTALKMCNHEKKLNKLMQDDLEQLSEQRCRMLEEYIRNITAKMAQERQLLDTQLQDIKQTNSHLECENNGMRQRIVEMEIKFAGLKKNCIPLDQLKDILADIRIQNDRLIKMQKSMQYYKDQWTKTACDLHQAKLFLLENQHRLPQSNNSNVDNTSHISLEDILCEEQDELQSHHDDIEDVPYGSTDDTSSSAVDLQAD